MNSNYLQSYEYKLPSNKGINSKYNWITFKLRIKITFKVMNSNYFQVKVWIQNTIELKVWIQVTFKIWIQFTSKLWIQINFK